MWLDGDDDMENYDDYDEADIPDYSAFTNQQQRHPRITGLTGELRGSGYNEMFDLVQQAAGHGAKIAELLVKAGSADQCKHMDVLLGQLAEFDKELDMDRRAVDETLRQHKADESEKPVMNKQFKQIRKNLKVNTPGQHQQTIQGVRNRLGQEAGSSSAQADDSVMAEDGEEMQMLNHYMSNLDPITKLVIQDPVKNPLCGHVYDRKSIDDYIKFNKERRQLYQCPVGQCKNRQQINMDQLMPFPEFFQLVRRARSRSRSRSRTRVRSRTRSRSPNEPSTSSGL